MDRPPWILDEVAHAGDEHLDPAYVVTYNDKAHVDPTEDLALLRTLGLNKRSVLVDLGAGSGAFALAAAALCRRVVAVDVSPAMFATLRAQGREHGLGNVEGVQGGFLTYVHQGDPADVVYSRHALHHLPDFWKATALVRVSSIMQPGGVLRLRDLVYACEPCDIERVIEPWLAAGAARPEDGCVRFQDAPHAPHIESPPEQQNSRLLATPALPTRQKEW